MSPSSRLAVSSLCLSLPAHSSLPRSVGNAMESGRLCLHFICVWDRGGFPDLMLGVFEGGGGGGEKAAISIKVAAPLTAI